MQHTGLGAYPDEDRGAHEDLPQKVAAGQRQREHCKNHEVSRSSNIRNLGPPRMRAGTMSGRAAHARVRAGGWGPGLVRQDACVPHTHTQNLVKAQRGGHAEEDALAAKGTEAVCGRTVAVSLVATRAHAHAHTNVHTLFGQSTNESVHACSSRARRGQQTCMPSVTTVHKTMLYGSHSHTWDPHESPPFMLGRHRWMSEAPLGLTDIQFAR